MNPSELEQYLYEHIPQSAAMQVRVASIGGDSLTLSAPLAPNINHRDSLFGGSAASIAILAAWAFLHVRVRGEGIRPTLVIQRHSMRFDAPVLGEVSATASLTDDADWQRFIAMLRRRGKARIGVSTRMDYAGQVAARMDGDFVAVMKE